MKDNEDSLTHVADEEMEPELGERTMDGLP